MNRKKPIIIPASVIAVVLIILCFWNPFGTKTGKDQNNGNYYELKDELEVGFSTPADACFVRDDDGSIPDEEMDKLIELFGHHKLGIRQGICSAGGWKGKKRWFFTIPGQRLFSQAKWSWSWMTRMMLRNIPTIKGLDLSKRKLAVTGCFL